MDLISIIGTILAFVVIIVGTILKGSTVDALWNPAAFVIVFLGTLAALLVQNHGKVLRHALRMMAMSPFWMPASTIESPCTSRQ